MTTYARPRLITEDDKRYRAHVAQFTLQRKNQKAMRPPRQRELFGGQAEVALRGWLAAQIELDERRILEYEERRNRSGFIKYRELDALHIAQRQAHVFEIKASRSASALRRAVGQLQETRAILRLLYPSVAVTVLLVDTGIPASAAEVEALMAGEPPPSRRPELLSEVLTAVPALSLAEDLAQTGDGERISLLRFGVEQIIALVGAENLALAWEQDELEPEDDPAPRPVSSLYTSSASADKEDSGGDDDDDNPMAAALRKAGLK